MRMDDDAVFALIATERRRAADMFGPLTAEQWAVQSLCAAWTVRDLAGHLIGPFCTSNGRFLLGALLGGGPHRYSARMSHELGQRPPAEIVAILRANTETRFAPPMTGPLAPLTDLAIHTRDAARPLGLDTTAPLPVWRLALGFLTSPKGRLGFVPRKRIAGLRLRAVDQDWASGDGPEVAGPSEALAMTIAGRAAAVGVLSGDGVPLLRARL